MDTQTLLKFCWSILKDCVIQIENEDSFNPLHYAANYNQVLEIAKIFLEKDIDIDIIIAYATSKEKIDLVFAIMNTLGTMSAKCGKYDLAMYSLKEHSKKIEKKIEARHPDLGSLYKYHQNLTEINQIINEAIRISVRFEIREPATPFVGRVQELKDLHMHLQNYGEILILQTATVTGQGGVGKSELAWKYISEHAKDYDHNLIKITADNYFTLVESFRKVAQRLGIKTEDENRKQKDVKEIVEEIYKFFTEKEKKSLFFFDNARKYQTIMETDEGLDKFLPTDYNKPNKPYVIITSSNQSWSESIAQISLKVFTEEEAIEFITEFLEDPEEDMKNLAEKVHHLPLALKQAVTCIRETNSLQLDISSSQKFTIKNYLERYDEFAKNLMGLNVDGYTETVLTTFSVSMNQIKKRNFGGLAEEILYILAYLLPDNIPAKGLFQILIADDKTLRDAVQLLHQYSMANFDGRVFNIHRVVQDVIKLQLQQRKEEENVLEKCLWLLAVHIRNKYKGEPYTAHAVTAWSQSKNYEQLVKRHPELPAQITDKLEESALYEETYLFGIDSINLLEKVLGPKNSYILPIMNTLGTVHTKFGKYDQAMHCFGKYLKNCKELLGDDHEDVLMIKNSIALTLKNLGHFDKALEYYEEVLLARKRILGDDHPDTSLTLHGIGLVYELQERFENAIEVFKNVAEKRKKNFSDDHPDVLDIENNIAGVLLGLGRAKILNGLNEEASELIKEALKSYKEVYEKQRRALGKHHPNALSTLHNIALCHHLLEEHDNNFQDVYADFDVNLLYIALSLKDVSFVDKYVNDHKSQIAVESNKSQIRNVIDKAYFRLGQDKDESGNLEIIIALLSTAIDESAEDALCRAVIDKSVDLVKYLLECRANPNEKNKGNKTALEISLEKLNEDPENEVLQAIYNMLISTKVI